MTKADEQERSKGDDLGKELHREFVGMLFALAIAEVAVKAGTLTGSGVPFKFAVTAYAHLILAATVITTSWVGWGWSKYGLRDVRLPHVFTRDYLELILDVWLVVLYFLIVAGVEVPTAASNEVVPSLVSETRWIATVFVTYFAWDIYTKWHKGWGVSAPLVQRGWASALCAGLAVFSYCVLPLYSSDRTRVLLGDLSLLCLVLLFRAMKIESLFALRARQWVLIAGLLSAWLIAGLVASS